MFSILTMSSAPADDRSTRARMRDAAVARFGRDGFGAAVRVIAADAGVSPGLVIHHFGSKDALRAECDEHVLRRIRESKTESLGDPTEMLRQLASVQEYAPLVAYTVQALSAGGTLAEAFVEQMVADATHYLAEAVAAGVVRPSRDPAARARYLMLANLGTLLVYLRLHPPVDGDLGRSVRELSAEITLPALELYTEGLLVERTMLDAYLAYVPDPPAGVTDPDAPAS